LHEVSLAEGVLGVVEDALRGEPGGVQVRSVRLEIGQLAAVEIEALRFAFDMVKRGSVADAARLDVIELPGQAWCTQCIDTVALPQRGEGCPRCGSYQLQVTGGDELRVKDIELA
jgi:hydrogenase nickel incorporation protein HypA/HybF